MKAFDFQPEFKKTVFPDGVRVVTEHHPQSRATSAGVFVGVGTRDEPKGLSGAAHFVEHMVFKGTECRSAMDIAKSLEAVGGDLNAYTSQEYTCYHATSLREHLPLSIDVLADLVSEARFSEDDFFKEREVIEQEIDMSADDLEEYVFDLFFEGAFRGHPLGSPILGTKDSLAQINRKKLFDFYQRRYQGKNIIVSVAGHVDHQEVVELVSQAITRKNVRQQTFARKTAKPRKFRKIVHKSSEQAHLLVGLPSSSFKGKLRFEAYIVNALLGGGMTSRLYQNIREKQALAYSVYSYLHSFSDSGLFMVYAGTSEKYFPKVLASIHKEIDRLVRKGVSQKDLNFFKTQVKGQILLGSDDIESRMSSLGVNEMVFGKYRPVDAIISEINSVSQESIRKYLDKYLDLEKISLMSLGDMDEDKTSKLFSQF